MERGGDRPPFVTRAAVRVAMKIMTTAPGRIWEVHRRGPDDSSSRGRAREATIERDLGGRIAQAAIADAHV